MEECEEFVVLTRSGDIIAGPFPTREAAISWVQDTYMGKSAYLWFGDLYVARRERPLPSTAGMIAVFNSRAEVPAACWDLQASGDLVLVDLPAGFVGAWMVGYAEEVGRR